MCRSSTSLSISVCKWCVLVFGLAVFLCASVRVCLGEHCYPSASTIRTQFPQFGGVDGRWEDVAEAAFSLLRKVSQRCVSLYVGYM